MSRGATIEEAVRLFERVDQLNDALQLILTGESETTQQLPNAMHVVHRELDAIVVEYLEWNQRRQQGRAR